MSNHKDKYCDVKPIYCSCNKGNCPHSKVNEKPISKPKKSK